MVAVSNDCIRIVSAYCNLEKLIVVIRESDPMMFSSISGPKIQETCLRYLMSSPIGNTQWPERIDLNGITEEQKLTTDEGHAS